MSSKQIGYAEALSHSRPPKKAGPKQIRSIEVEKGEDGGHVATHRFKQTEGGPYRDSQGPKIFGESEGRDLVQHLIEHLGIKGVKVSAATNGEENED